ncbi:hypothetical protein ATCC90586_009260 [Pythium insidiosum]|nr:hypothetical protein ATCC90586_009260 [Pythium insidiosum]
MTRDDDVVPLKDGETLQVTDSSVRCKALHRLLHRHRRTLSKQFERDQPFSVSRFLLAVFSYSLLVSDVLRTGTALRTLEPHPVTEPDNVITVGPYAYPLLHLRWNDTAVAPPDATVPFWPYKYDSTSMTMRAVAELLAVPNWSSCVLWRTPVDACNEPAGLPVATVFRMIDSMVESVKQHAPMTGSQRHSPSHHRAAPRGHVMARSEHTWADRLNNHLLPHLFRRRVRRTSQARHFDLDRMQRGHGDMCGASRPRPFSCDLIWSRFTRICPPTNPICGAIDHIWLQLPQRLRTLRAAFPNRSIDLVVLEGMDDPTPGGIVSHGRRDQDVVVFTRVRDCASAGDGTCETVAVDDFRHEAAAHTMSVLQWQHVIGALRITGQAYMWLRLLLLFAGVLYARASEFHWEQQGSVRKLLFATLRTFFLIPNQVVTYGSVFPILCYVSAHSIDVSAVYEFVAHHFSTPLGQYHFKLGEVVELGAVSMRSMWVMAAFCHLVVAISTRRSWTPENGVIGIPEFFITLVAASTIFAHARIKSWRVSRIEEVVEVPSTPRLVYTRVGGYEAARGFLSKLLIGLTIDIQFLLSSFVAVAVAIGVFELLRRLALTFLRHKLVIVSRTLVPYSASSLWLTNALVISWHGTIVTRVVERAVSTTAAPKLAMLQPARPPQSGRSASHRRSTGRDVLFMTQSARSAQYQREMSVLNTRSPEIESLIYLVNVAVLTDPLTFLRSRVLGGALVGLYQSRRSDRCFLLPYRLGSESSADAHIDLSDFDLLGVFDTKEVYWWDLLQCG